MHKGWWIAPLLCQLIACNSTTVHSTAERKALAERFFRGVYGCDPSVVQELGGDDIVISYPIFQNLFDTPAIRGREAVEQFATGFCNRWKDAQITIHEAVAERDNVVLVWSFQARNVESGQQAAWGGITLFRFDGTGKIVAEIGEESEPGPVERLAADGATR
jgi:hypothetical protein